jgi:hypothetical protein
MPTSPIHNIETLLREMVMTEIAKIQPAMEEKIRAKILAEMREFITETPISEKEACTILGCEPSTIAKHRTRKDNPLPYIKGRPCKYVRSQVKAWLKSTKGIYTQNA